MNGRGFSGWLARRQMNAPLRICPAWRVILGYGAEILNAGFICRH